MSALTFTLKAVPAHRIDCSPLTSSALANKSVPDIAATLLQSGNQKLRTDSVFEITGDDCNDIVFKNSHGKLDNIGQNLKSGRITVHGDAGAYLGLQMGNGEITVHGNVGDFAASGLAKGLIHIHGNVGDFLGAAIVGDRKGMKGGTVIVTGNAGERVGDQMRRGMILIEGNAGSYCASRMLAGTIGVLGSVGDYVGFSMRRGTIILTKTPKLHPTLQDCGPHTLPFLSLMFKALAQLPTKFGAISQNRVQRYAGDLANDGKGEILVFK